MKKSLQSQRGAMSTGAIIAILATVMVVVGVIAFALTYMGYANYGNRSEKSLEALLDKSKNVYAQGTQRVMEVAQVPAMARDDIAKVVAAAIEGRYGADGSKAIFQMITEQNPSVDPKLYVTVQQEIRGFRKDFENAQNQMRDVLRSYDTALGNMPGSFFLSMAGYPKIDLTQFKPIITDRTEDVYKAGKESGPLQLR